MIAVVGSLALSAALAWFAGTAVVLLQLIIGRSGLDAVPAIILRGLGVGLAVFALTLWMLHP